MNDLKIFTLVYFTNLTITVCAYGIAHKNHSVGLTIIGLWLFLLFFPLILLFLNDKL